MSAPLSERGLENARALVEKGFELSNEAARRLLATLDVVLRQRDTTEAKAVELLEQRDAAEKAMRRLAGAATLTVDSLDGADCVTDGGVAVLALRERLAALESWVPISLTVKCSACCGHGSEHGKRCPDCAGSGRKSAPSSEGSACAT